MKKNIHPTYYPNAEYTCACGKKHIFGSTKEKQNIEICSNCHPFFTGKQQLIDTAGRVEKFEKRKLKAETPKIKKTRVKKPKNTEEK